MDITIQRVYLPHHDPRATLSFYRDTLGFEVRDEVGHDGLSWITVGPPGRPDTSLVLQPPALGPGITEDERRTLVEMMAKGTYARITLATADLDDAFARLRERGAEVVEEPTRRDHGLRGCAVRDPAGTLIRINEPR